MLIQEPVRIQDPIKTQDPVPCRKDLQPRTL